MEVLNNYFVRDLIIHFVLAPTNPVQADKGLEVIFYGQSFESCRKLLLLLGDSKDTSASEVVPLFGPRGWLR